MRLHRRQASINSPRHRPRSGTCSNQHHRDSGECEQIRATARSDQHRRQDRCGRRGASSPKHEPDCKLSKRRARDRPPDGTSICPKCDPHTDLTRAARDGKGSHPVEPAGCQQHRDRREGRKHRAEQPLWPELTRQRFVHRHCRQKRQVCVERSHLLANERRSEAWSRRRTRHDLHRLW